MVDMISVDNYIVTISKNKSTRALIGIYPTLEKAKTVVESTASIIQGDKEFVSIAKINLEDSKVYDFYRKDLTLSREKYGTFKAADKTVAFPRPFAGRPFTESQPESPFMPIGGSELLTNAKDVVGKMKK